MDEFKQRRKKSDKAKEKYEKNGNFSSKHIRIVENLKNKKST
jgi:hypothetical protein